MTNLTQKLTYFGYGANREPRMISAITGIPIDELVGKPVVLEGYALGVQSLDDIPNVPPEGVDVSARDILDNNWGESFQSYVIFEQEGGTVAGTAWELTEEQRDRVADWELIAFNWYKDIRTRVRDADGNYIDVRTEIRGDGQGCSEFVDGMNYESWLQNPELFEEIAAEARREYDERQMNTKDLHRPNMA